MFSPYWKSWSPAAFLGLFAWDSVMPLSSLADIDEPRIGIICDASLQPVAFQATGFPPRNLRYLKTADAKANAFSRIFAVYETNSDDDSAPPISGNYLIEGGRLTFFPFQPLQPGLKYRAVLQVQGIASADRPLLGIAIHCDVTIPVLPAKTAANQA